MPVTEPAPPEPTPPGRAWIDPHDPDVLHLDGEVDQPVVQDALASLTDEDLAAVDVVDMAGVTFIDSSAISLIANLLRTRTRDHPLVVDQAPDLAVFILDVAGLTDELTIKPA